jgi:hypothetical protein
MLQAADDFPFHQTVQTFDTPATADPRWFDRYWFMTGSVDERICLITGIGTYPNTRRIDAYAMLSDGRTQWNLRVGRERDGNPLALDAHGLSFSLLDPMARWSLECEGRDELGFALEFEQRYPPNNLPPLFVQRDGEVIMEMGHFAQGGEMRGRLRAGERTLDVAGWASERDHSWGRRPPSGKVRSGIHVWLPCQVGRRQIWVWFRENAAGERVGLEGVVRDRDGGAFEVTDVRHEIQAVEAVAPHRQLVHARLTLTLENGEELEVDVEPIIPVFIAGGGYVDGELAQGSYEGASMSSWTIDDDGRKEIPLGIIDHFCRVSAGGETGQGVFELSLGRYAPLGFADPQV